MVNDILDWRDKIGTKVHVMHVLFMFFAFLKNLKSFSENNLPVHALDDFIENATKMV